MAAQLALSRTDVKITDPVTEATTEIENVSLIVRSNAAKLQQGRDVVREMAGVTKVEQVSRGVWEISGNGGVWKVTRRRGACCGRA